MMYGFRFILFSLSCILVFCSWILQGQSYDLILKNGIVVDPKNKIHSKKDIGIKDGKIIAVSNTIKENVSKKIIDVSGMYVCPGLIDLHTHVFVGNNTETFANGINSISPDDFTLKAGVTTVVDAGTSGYRNFPLFKSQVIDKSKTRILAFLNIAANGMTGDSLQEDIHTMNADSASSIAIQFPGQIVGIKIGHIEKYHGEEPFNLALDAANQIHKPLFVECHLPFISMTRQLDKMRQGDIITHSYEEIKEREPILDSTGKLRDYILKAREKGILFDLGHGGAGFWFSQAIPAIRQGLLVNSFGTDMHRFSVNAGMKDLLNVMSKFMAMGLSLDQVVERATCFPAKSIHREDLGSLSIGNVADIAVISIRNGQFGYFDAGGNKIMGSNKLECELTIRNGQVVWDLNGLNAKPFKNTK